MRVTSARDAAEIDARLRAGRFDLIVLDVMMPGEDGLSACRFVAAVGPTPVMLLTALGEKTHRIVGLEIGAEDYRQSRSARASCWRGIKAILRGAERPERSAGALSGRRVAVARGSSTATAGLSSPTGARCR